MIKKLPKLNIDNIFKIKNKSEFSKLALEIFYLQAEKNEVYKSYIEKLNVKPKQISCIKDIPFLPIEFFKTKEPPRPPKGGFDIAHAKKISGGQKLFLSSGTTGAKRSRHLVSDISVYEKSLTKCFELFYGDIEKYCMLALLPGPPLPSQREGDTMHKPSERMRLAGSVPITGGESSFPKTRHSVGSPNNTDHSSLVYMANSLIKQTKNIDSGFFLDDFKKLSKKLSFLEKKKQKTILLGVTYALLDFAEQFPVKLNHTTVMETGGMKGIRKELVREDLHQQLCSAFGVTDIHSEYGMTELLSQAYSKGNGIFQCPQWMKIFIRDPNDFFELLDKGLTGGINVIDLANINSCSFIATQDLGRVYSNGSFEVLGRFDNSEVRGCNLLFG